MRGTASARDLTGAERAVIEASRRFAFDLLKEVNQGEGGIPDVAGDWEFSADLTGKNARGVGIQCDVTTSMTLYQSSAGTLIGTYRGGGLRLNEDGVTVLSAGIVGGRVYGSVEHEDGIAFHFEGLRPRAAQAGTVGESGGRMSGTAMWQLVSFTCTGDWEAAISG